MNASIFLLIGILIGIAVGSGIAYIIARNRRLSEHTQLQIQLQTERDKYEAALQVERDKSIAALQAERDKSEAAIQAERKIAQAANQAQEEKFQANLKLAREEMRNTAEKEFKERVTELKAANNEQIQHIVEPLRKQIEDFQKLVNSNKTEQDKNTAELKTAIRMMYDNDRQRDKVTESLANALKNKGKVQGDWGEQVLENILRDSGLRENEEYFVQTNVKDDEGHNLRPDVLVKMSNDTQIIIDSKVSLTAYTNYCGAETDEERLLAERENHYSIWKHVEELSAKNYPALTAKAIPFSLMFIPNEGSYLLAMNHDRDLGAKAFKKGVILVNPTNLMIVLYLISKTWQSTRQEKLNKQILDAAAGIYEKYATFAEEYVKLGNQLNTARSTYETGLGQLREGRGNLSSRIEKLQKLGITTAKRLPNAIESLDESEID